MSKILLIEDDEAIGFIYKRQLELAGLSTDHFTTGKDGLASIEKNNYSLILLDIMLPDLNGLDVLKEIKKNQNNKNIPIVLLTNLGQDDVIKEGFKLGADGYLLKASLTPDQVVKEVQHILQTKTIPNSN